MSLPNKELDSQITIEKELLKMEAGGMLPAWFNALVAAKKKESVSPGFYDEALGRFENKIRNTLKAEGAEITSLQKMIFAKNLVTLHNSLENQAVLRETQNSLLNQFEKSGLNNLVDLLNEVDQNKQTKSNEANMTLAKSMETVVTIWVDKGYRVEQGMGIPDRVVGSGFFIEENGYILTNYHVIQSEVDPAYEGYSRLYIRPFDKPQEKIPAKVVAWDQLFDLALLKTEVDAPRVLAIAGNDDLEIGTTVFALGSPGGLENSATTGIVSARGRRLLEMDSVIQVDAAINPGNSGGPLLGPDYSFSGVVFAGVERFEGVNFALPSTLVRAVLPHFLFEENVTHPWLGIQVFESQGSLVVSYVVPGSPAKSLGIEQGDVLISFNSASIGTVAGAQREILKFFPGQIVSINWRKGNGSLTRLELGPEQSGQIALETRQKEALLPFVKAGFHRNLTVPLFGFSVRSISTGLFGTEFVVDEVIPFSMAEESNISAGDPFRLNEFGCQVEPTSKQNLAYLHLTIQKRKSGFADSTMQLATFLSSNNYL